jgi:hypothetical protein
MIGFNISSNFVLQGFKRFSSLIRWLSIFLKQENQLYR